MHVKTRLDWKAKDAERHIMADSRRRLDAAGMTLVSHAREKVSQLPPSSPGGYPAKRMGDFRKSIDYYLYPNKLGGRWGTNLKYGKFLELGTKPHKIVARRAKVLANKETGEVFGKEVEVSMEPRPWMSLTNKACRRKVKKLLTGKLT
jgi:hypothetical protein